MSTSGLAGPDLPTNSHGPLNDLRQARTRPTGQNHEAPRGGYVHITILRNYIFPVKTTDGEDLLRLQVIIS